MSLTLNTYYNNYSNENTMKVMRMYRSYFPNINFNRLDFNGRMIKINKNIVKEIKDLRDNKCLMRGNICKKIEIGGIINYDNNGNCRIVNIQNGEGDTINIVSNNLNDILFHTHPNSFGIWNKASPPSEYDLYNSLQYATKGINKINLIWDAHGIYIYYIYPEIVKQLNNVDINRYSDILINILRWTKMGFGFYYNNKDYKSQYSSFSQYRNLLKYFGIYVDYKKYNKKMKFIVPY